MFIPKIPGKLRNSVAYYTQFLISGKRPGASRGMPDPKRPPSSLRRVTSTRRAYPPPPPGKYVRRGLLVLIKSALSASPGMPVVPTKTISRRFLGRARLLTIALEKKKRERERKFQSSREKRKSFFSPPPSYLFLFIPFISPPSPPPFLIWRETDAKALP